MPIRPTFAQSLATRPLFATIAAPQVHFHTIWGSIWHECRRTPSVKPLLMPSKCRQMSILDDQSLAALLTTSFLSNPLHGDFRKLRDAYLFSTSARFGAHLANGWPGSSEFGCRCPEINEHMLAGIIVEPVFCRMSEFPVRRPVLRRVLWPAVRVFVRRLARAAGAFFSACVAEVLHPPPPGKSCR